MMWSPASSHLASWVGCFSTAESAQRCSSAGAHALGFPERSTRQKTEQNPPRTSFERNINLIGYTHIRFLNLSHIYTKEVYTVSTKNPFNNRNTGYRSPKLNSSPLSHSCRIDLTASLRVLSVWEKIMSQNTGRARGGLFDHQPKVVHSPFYLTQRHLKSLRGTSAHLKPL